MTCKTEDTAYSVILEQLIEDGTSGIKQAMTIMLNEAMKLERQRYQQAEPYERTESRADYSNGFKSKTIRSAVGEMKLSVPQVRSGNFYPSALAKGRRTDRALLLSLAEMYVQGTSTRKVSKIVEELCGFEVSSTEVSRASKLLDEELSKWRKRTIPAMRYLYLDARYEKIRHGASVIDCAVLIAVGVNEKGRRSVLGVSVSLSEAEPHWREFMKELTGRGLCGVELIISDDHAGLKAARKAVFPGVKWQRCQFHLQQNAQKYVPKKSMKTEVASEIRSIFNAKNTVEATRLLNNFMADYAKTAPKLVEWAERAIPEGLTVFDLPEAHRRNTRTTNMLERLNREILRRTRVATLFPNEASCLRLVSAVLMETSEEWETGRRYMAM